MNKIILITGVSRGLGRFLTEALIESGHTILGCARCLDKINQLQQQFGQPHHFTQVDVTSNQEVQAWSKLLLSQYDPPELLINNAALVNRPAPLWQVDIQDFSDLIDVNVKGIHNIIHSFVPAMIERQRGIIVNFSSGWGRYAAANFAPYCASKFAIEGLTLSLAQELPPTLAAIPLSPGIIHTPMLETVYGQEAANYTSPQDWVKKAVPFLLQLGLKDNGQSLSIPA